MNVLFRLILISSFCVSCNEEKDEKKTTEVLAQPETSIDKTTQYTTSVFLIDSLHPQSGFGYTILLGGTIFIHQPTIPSIQGNKPFDSKEQAELVANLMIYKLEHHMMPPSVSKKELDSLGIVIK